MPPLHREKGGPEMRSDYYNSIRALLFVTMIAYMVIMCVAE